MRTLTVDEARAFYDRFGKQQDSRWIHDDPATARLADALALAGARQVVELGCGTGRFAEALLAERLPAEARYLALDVSSTMIRIAGQRLDRFGARAEARLTDGRMQLPMGSGACDRVVSAYLLDLLSDEDIDRFLVEAERVLEPGGLLGVVSLTCGTGAWSKLVTRAWQRVFAWKPALLGGCRPVQLRARIAARFELQHAQLLERFGVSTEVLVGKKR